MVWIDRNFLIGFWVVVYMCGFVVYVEGIKRGDFDLFVFDKCVRYVS